MDAVPGRGRGRCMVGGGHVGALVGDRWARLGARDVLVAPLRRLPALGSLLRAGHHITSRLA